MHFMFCSGEFKRLSAEFYNLGFTEPESNNPGLTNSSLCLLFVCLLILTTQLRSQMMFFHL